MTDQIPDISDLTTVARTASLSLAVATAGVKNRALEAIAIALEERRNLVCEPAGFTARSRKRHVRWALGSFGVGPVAYRVNC